MTKSDKSVMHQALNALENLELDGDYAEGFWSKRSEAIDALRAAIAQPEQISTRGTDAQILKEREITTSAIVGAMAYGFQNGEYPPDDSAWLRPFWEMGRHDAKRQAAIAHPEQPENSGELHFPLMCKAFRTTVSQGLDKRYEMVFAFPDLTALHAADTEWLNFREAAIAQPVKPEYANAYYEICEILGLSAMSVSPEIAHKTVVIPLLKSIFSFLPARCDQTRFCEKHPNCSPACTAIAQPEQQTEQNFCAHCGKRLAGDGIHTCTPPKDKQ